MPAVQCPIPGCGYITDDLDASIVAALLNAHTTTHTHPSGAHAASLNAKVEKVRRPTITANGTSEDWQYFKTRWAEYVSATHIKGPELIIQLLECCDENLRKDLTRNAGGSLTSKTEEQVLNAIHTLAVRQENTMVARVNLHSMRQDRDEPVRAFGARVKGQAGICKFSTKCPSCNTDVNYTDCIIKDVVMKGIADQEIQLDLLGERDQDMSLDDLLQYIEAKESGKRSASRLYESSPIDSVQALSSYQKQKKVDSKSKDKFNDSEPCFYCGQSGHGARASLKQRKNTCKAYGHTCEKCGRSHHYGSVCRSKPSNSNARSADALFICSSTNDKSTNSRQKVDSKSGLNHHIYDKNTNDWIERQSKEQPVIDIEISTTHGLGFSANKLTTCTQSALADTGCQSCLAGVELLSKLGVSQNDLLPVKTKIKAANDNSIALLGAIPLSMTARGRNTKQMTYITDVITDRLFLSKEACIDLGIINPLFPHVNVANITETTSEKCSCPQRQKPPPPPTLPFPATEENCDKLKKYLLDYYKSSTFNTCKHQPLPLMEGPPLQLMVDPEAEPVAYHTPIPVPVHWQQEVKEGLDQDVRLGVLEPVPVGEPVTWCHRMVICAKKNGKPRRTVDFQPLNKFATRETHHTPSPFHQARSVPCNKKKTVLDAWNGYHSVPIREEDRHLTTFITPWGRYRYKTTPQGYIASGDGYTRRYDEIVSSIQNKTKCIDDALIWSDDIEESFHHTVNWLDICGRHGITLNPEKFQFAQDFVEFAGFNIGPSDVKPAAQMHDAIRNFPSPKTLTDLRSWFGLINQVSYTFSMAKETQPFRDLLKPKAMFKWTDELEELFQRSKLNIINEMENGVKIFDKSRPTCVATDWSKTGIGFWVLQKHCQCSNVVPFCCPNGWKVTLVGSRFTHSAEANYAPIEGEALAVAEALNKARYFVLGCKKLIVAVDHKPLLKIFGSRSLNDIPNPRLRNLKEKTLGFHFTMVHVAGRKHRAADTISRTPTGLPEKMILTDDIATLDTSHDTVSLLDLVRSPAPREEFVEPLNLTAFSLSTHPLQNVTWDRVRIATTSELHDLTDVIQSGFPYHKDELPPSLREFFRFQDDLSLIDGVILYKDRVVIPPSLRNEVIATLHAAHQGTTSMISRAEASVFWPGITTAIHNYRSSCSHCNRNAPSNPNAPPTPLPEPTYPFQLICADFFHYKGHYYLVIVDRYSNWPIVERAEHGSQGLISCLKQTFTTFGIAEELSSDGGPEFMSTDFKQFMKQWGIHHRVSSVAYPHSNCRAEIGVKTVKRLLMDNVAPNGSLHLDNFQRAILNYRNTPDRDTRLSPAQCIFGRPIRDFLPIHPGRYHPHMMWSDTLNRREDALRDRHIKCAERLSISTKRLPPLVVGDKVRVQNQTGPQPLKWDRTGVIVEVRQFDQYVVRLDGSRRVTLRNRKFLRKYIPALTPLPIQNPKILFPQSTSVPVSDKSGPTGLPIHSQFDHNPGSIPEAIQSDDPIVYTNVPTTPSDDLPQNLIQPSPIQQTPISKSQVASKDNIPSLSNDRIQPRRSERLRKIPSHLKDYKLY